MTRVQQIAGAFVATIFVTSLALAGGFQLNEVGARAMGMGGAFAAQSNDLSAMYFNPAGLATQMGFRASVGATMIMPSSSYTTTAGASTDMVSQTFFPPNVYASYGLQNGLVFGVGFFAPFGLGTEWPAGWVGRYYAMKADIQDFVLNPTVAYKVNDKLLVGAGFSYMFSNVKLSYNIRTFSALPPIPANISPTDGSVTLDADGNSWGFDVGAIYKPLPAMSVGASYRHSTEVTYEGTATFTSMQAVKDYFPGGTGQTAIKFPNQVFTGISYQFTPSLLVEFDFQWIGWSTYDTLSIILPSGPNFPYTPGKPLQASSKSPKSWYNATMLRLGGEYQYQAWAFRLGFIYDTTPQPSQYVEPILPDANRMEGTIGLGYKFSDNLSVDAAYQLILFNDRTVTGPTTGDMNKFPGTYKSSANLFALSVSYFR